MSDPQSQINTKNPITNALATKNIDKIDTMIIKEVEDSMEKLEGDVEDIESIMKVLRDRMIETPDHGFPISLARFAEIKLATRKQKNELLKTLIAYKTNEQVARKRTSDSNSSIQDIMAGVGLGAALSGGKKLNISGTGTDVTGQSIQIERTDIIDAEIELEEGETAANSVIRNFNNG